MGIDVSFSGLLRLSNNTEVEDIALMVRSGFSIIKFGLESGSPFVRQKMKKNSDQDHCYNLIKAVAENGALAQVNIMHSFPVEEEQHFIETMDFLSLFKPEEIQWNAWSFNLGFTGNGAIDFDFIDRFGITLERSNGMVSGRPSFVLDLKWRNAIINDGVRADRQNRIQSFRRQWLGDE
jgi:hypothetical protein